MLNCNFTEFLPFLSFPVYTREEESKASDVRSNQPGSKEDDNNSDNNNNNNNINNNNNL